MSPKRIATLLALAGTVAIATVYVHFRGRVRFKLARQLGDHSTYLAPLNALLYLSSKVPARPYLNADDFPHEVRRGCLTWRTRHKNRWMHGKRCDRL